MRPLGGFVLGNDQVLKFEVGGFRFGYRMPSSTDVDEIQRRYVAKTGLDVRLIALDGFNIGWQVRLEVGLRPLVVDGHAIKLGEEAPPHWLDDGEISFDNVFPEEFRAVQECLSPLLTPRHHRGRLVSPSMLTASQN